MDEFSADRRTVPPGGDRSSAPKSADDDYLEIAQKIGVTRLAAITGLDRVGLPVAAAFRPNSRSVCVNHGKGISIDDAKGSALGEAIELFHAETIELPTFDAPYSAMNKEAQTVSPYTLTQRAGANFETDCPIRWVTGVGLYDDLPVSVPLAGVSMDMTDDYLPGSELFIASSTGLGTRTDIWAAILHGLCEVVERDAHALWLSRGNTLANVSPVSSSTISSKSVLQLTHQIEEVGLTIGLADLTSDIPVPTILAVILDQNSRHPNEVPFALGTACHPDKNTAALKAIQEAAQMRLLQITSVRDDLQHSDYQIRNYEIRETASNMLGSQAAVLPDFTDTSIHSIHDAASFVERALKQAQQAQPILVNLTKRSIGIPVVKIIIPGLEDGLDLKTQKLGQRGFSARMEVAP